MSVRRRHLEKFGCVGQPCLIQSPRKELQTDGSLNCAGEQFMHLKWLTATLKSVRMDSGFTCSP